MVAGKRGKAIENIIDRFKPYHVGATIDYGFNINDSYEYNFSDKELLFSVLVQVTLISPQIQLLLFVLLKLKLKLF